MNNNGSTTMSFWEHLEELRGCLLKTLIVVAICTVVAFLCKEELFAVILAPKEEYFITYRMINNVAKLLGNVNLQDTHFHVDLINTGLAGQFLMHMKAAFATGVVCASPYMLFLLFKFVSPGLYPKERTYAVRAICIGYAMFIVGVLLCYFLIFPLTFRFLGTYQVENSINNLITLDSYISTLMTLSVAIGLVFEMPVLCWFFARIGIITAVLMRQFRRYAIVLVLIIAAVITPTSDIFTLSLVALPMLLLYEISIVIVAHSYK